MMGTPVVVQGTAVPAPQFQAQPYDNGGGGGLQQSEKQESSCNDALFAVLFYGCVGGLLYTAVTYGPSAVTVDTNSGQTDWSGYVYGTVIILVISFFAAALGMAVMMAIPQFLIKTSLICVVIFSGVIMVINFAAGQIFGGIIALVFFLFSLCYARAVWSRIPFATINLVTACKAIKKHLTVVLFAYFFAALAGGWSVAWAVATVGTYDKVFVCDVNDVCSVSSSGYGILFGLFIAYFFGEQVFQNSIHVCVAGTVGSWWFEPDDSSVGCCDSNVFNSLIRTMTTSFGSICFGSLLVAILEALKALAQTARENGDNAILACIAECILGCLASMLEYFNRWAFVYVGLYGMPYCKAGQSVMELFRNRGWEAIIADDLVGNCLSLVAIVVGLIMAGVGAALAASSNFFDGAGSNKELWAALIGLVVGFVITSILMSTIGSAVNTVIVLFAEAPSEFQQNHPELSTEMRRIWSEVYPGSI